MPTPPPLSAGSLETGVAPGSLVLHRAAAPLSERERGGPSEALLAGFARAYAFTGLCTERVPVNAKLNGRRCGGLRI